MVYHNFKTIFEKYHLLVVHHLTPKELFKLAATSRKNYYDISQCKQCMGRMVVHLHPDRDKNNSDLRAFLDSRREYKNFKLSCSHDTYFSECYILIAHLFKKSLNYLELLGCKITDSTLSLRFPKLMKLKIVSSDINTLKVFLPSCETKNLLIIESTLEAITSREIIEEIMKYKSVKLKNVNFKIVSNLDFLYNRCVDFEFECDQRSDMSNLCLMFRNGVRCNELMVKKRQYPGYKLFVHRFVNNEDYFIPSSTLYKRKLRKRHMVEIMNKIADNSWNNSNESSELQLIPSQHFSITLEIDNLSWNNLLRLSKCLQSLRILRIFEIPERTRNELFRFIPSLQMIIVIDDDEMETETSYPRGTYVERKERDPIWRVPLNVQPLIFQHLDHDEKEQASMVSARWNDCIHENSKYMEKIHLSLKRSDLLSNDYQYLLKSKRFYENLEMDCEKDVNLVNKALDVVHMFSQNLIELHLFNVSADKDKNYGTFVLPKLRILDIHSVDEEICKMIFDNLTTLRSLTMRNIFVNARYGERILKQKYLEKVVTEDCKFLHFNDCPVYIDFDLEHLKHLELSFFWPNSWKKQMNVGLDIFMNKFSLFRIKRFKASGLRAKELNPRLRVMRNLSKLEFGGVWQSDLENLEIVETKCPLDIYVPNVEYLNAVEWKTIFPSMQSIRVGSMSSKKRLEECDVNFIKQMGLSGKKLIRNKLYALEDPSMFVKDPIARLPEDVQDLIFQHFNFEDSLNVLETSPTWHLYASQSKVFMQRIMLKSPYSESTDFNEVLIRSTTHYQKAYVYSMYLKSIANFAKHLIELSIKMGSKEFRDTIDFEFPNLEVLYIVKKESYEKYQNVVNVLAGFVKCTKLRILSIREEVSYRSCPHVLEMLKNNDNLTELKIEICTGYETFLKNDFMNSKFNFKLTRFIFGIPENDNLNYACQDNLIKFLKLHAETLKVCHLRYTSGKIMNEILTNFPVLEQFYTIRFFDYDKIDAPINTTIKRFIFHASTLDRVEIFVTRLPFLQQLYIKSINKEILNFVAHNLHSLKVLSYHEDKDGGIKAYRKQVDDDNVMLMNKNITFYKINEPKFNHLAFYKLFEKDNFFRRGNSFDEDEQ